MSNLFMVDIEGKKLLDIEKKILQNPNVGAVILFTRNYENPEQLKHLLQEVREIRPDLFIATDHEGGMVQRFQRYGFRFLPAARVYGDTYDINPDTAIQLAKQYGEILAVDLLEHDIDLSLAPVLDLHNDSSQIIGIYDRAFHAFPDPVIAIGREFISGMAKAGMPAVCKHFPGHGSCSADSHTELAIYRGSEQDFNANDLKPFVELIKDGTIDAVMAAHVVYPHLDPDNPAGFSKYILKDFLRGELNFNGMVFSDCLSMKGADLGDIRKSSQRALEAGCDMLIVCNQSRPLLLSIINETQFVPNAAAVQRLKNFKEKMSRFKPRATSPLRFVNS